MLKITIEVEPGQEAETLSALALAFGAESPKEKPAPEKKEKPAPKKKEKPTPKEEEKSTPKEEEEKSTPKEEPTEDHEITIDEVRTELAKKVKDHRDAIKKKLTELEASNVTSLQSKHYPEFMEFLEGLD